MVAVGMPGIANGATYMIDYTPEQLTFSLHQGAQHYTTFRWMVQQPVVNRSSGEWWNVRDGWRV